MVNHKQREDFNNSLVNSTRSSWFSDQNEPTSKSGLNKGLSLVLDAHTDMLETGTVSDDTRVSNNNNNISNRTNKNASASILKSRD